MKCLKVIKRNKKGDIEQEQYLRVEDSIAALMVEQKDVSYTSKSKFKRAVKSNKPKFSAGGHYPGESRVRRALMKEKKKTGLNGKHTENYKKNFQKVLSKPDKIFVKRYLPKSALKKIALGQITEKEAMKTLAKNRYVKNTDVKVVKTIKHLV